MLFTGSVFFFSKPRKASFQPLVFSKSTIFFFNPGHFFQPPFFFFDNLVFFLGLGPQRFGTLFRFSKTVLKLEKTKQLGRNMTVGKNRSEFKKPTRASELKKEPR